MAWTVYTATVIDSKKDRNRMHEVTEMQLHRRDKNERDNEA